MRPLRLRLDQEARRTGAPFHVVEKDYALGYVLAGLSAHPVLGQRLVFKGGTALRKLFFGDYRFSEDLDFSAPEGPQGPALASYLEEALREVGRLLEAQGSFALEWRRYTERDPHPGGQEAFLLRLRFPWHPEPRCRVKLEITLDEPVLLAPEPRLLLHGYEESLPARVRCYRLEEIVAEKLRALRQTHQHLTRRGWSRTRVRDYYDLWRILRERGDALERGSLPDLLARKCAVRGVHCRSLEEVFPEELVAEARRHWQASLGAFVQELPPVDTVLRDLRELLPDCLPDLR